MFLYQERWGYACSRIQRLSALLEFLTEQVDGWRGLTKLVGPIIGSELDVEVRGLKPALSAIEDNSISVLVTTTEVPEPVAVRYA